MTLNEERSAPNYNHLGAFRARIRNDAEEIFRYDAFKDT